MTHPPTFRSLLAVPASSPRFMEKAAQGPADSVFLDLEDAVIASLKPKARQDAINAINQLDWGTRGVAVRVNGFGTPWSCRDIIEIVEACPRLDYILLPKCESPEDMHAVDVMIRSAEAIAPRERQVGIMGLIETPRGVANVETIAQAGGRLRALVFGGGDYQLDLGSFQRAVGAPAADYVVLTDADARGARERHWNDLWHFATARIANACRAFGIMPIDGPFSGILDSEGLHAATKRASMLGFECKMAIHPSQIEIIHEVMTPSAAQITWANEVLEAMEAAAREGRGAVKDKNGEMIDLMHIKVAQKLIDRAKRLGNKV
ncbi:CoA ester lyase [uncultured Bradyrhizobium sp.]|uniref:HpcH/HpaI aldolase/citrate lyase family protein n=1 Tax=Bradyrhizobium sp. TaxID=376 RepID=UPI00261F4177|nr:CoA ester lyase [uncultured Bradyrhizobium sp.]